ncbi:hypothetical protein [Methylobacterium sp. J-077]|nr:hypothetical protein [Methylobacterium sp. J-077]
MGADPGGPRSGAADGLNTRQQAAGVYSIMVAKGLISEGRA